MKGIGAMLVLIGGLIVTVMPAIMFFYGIVLMVMESFFYGLFAAIVFPALAWLVGAVMIFFGSLMVGD